MPKPDPGNSSAEMDYLNILLQKWMPSQQRVAVDSMPTLHGIWDTINATLATPGPPTRLPMEFYDAQARAMIDRIVTEEEYSGYKESNEYRTLGIGAMLGDVVQRMMRSSNYSEEKLIVNRTSSPSSPPGIERMSDNDHPPFPSASPSNASLKFALFGTHDSTIAATLASLGALEGELNTWPSYTSSLAIELFQAIVPTEPNPSTSPSSTLLPHHKPRLAQHYVRIRYNDRPITIPACRAQGRHFENDESICTFVSTFWRFFFLLFFF